MEANNSMNPLFLCADDGTLSNKALKKLGSDFNQGNSLIVLIAVTLRNIFKSMNCTTLKNKLNNYFINRAVIIIKDRNCQFVKETFHINLDFHGWCLIEKILGDDELVKRSLIKTGPHFAMIKEIYNDFKDGDKPYFEFEYNCANELDQNEFILKYQPSEKSSINKQDNLKNSDFEDSRTFDDEDSSLIGSDSDSENEILKKDVLHISNSYEISAEKSEENKELTAQKDRSMSDKLKITSNEGKDSKMVNTNENFIQEVDEEKQGTKEPIVEQIITEPSELNLTINIDKENLAPDLHEEEQKSKETKENNNKSNEQKNTIEPKVKIEISIEKKNKNESPKKDPLASTQKKRSIKNHKGEKKIASILEPTDQLHKAFTEEPVLTGLNLFGNFLAPFLNKTDLDIVKDSLRQTASLFKQHHIPVELGGEAKIKQDIKASTLEVMNHLKSEDFKNLLNCLGKEKNGKLNDKNIIGRPLSIIQKDSNFLKNIAKKSVAVVTNMFSLEQLRVTEKNKGQWLKDDPKQLSEKIKDIYLKLETVFSALSPTKFALKTVLSSKLKDKVSEKGLEEINHSIAPFIDIFVDHWDEIEDKYQIFAHLKQFEALTKKIEKKPFSDSEAANELNKLLTLTFDTNLVSFYGPLNASLNQFMNAEHS